nr:MAG TPA: hypothetical protein [Bacteriophage sp.]
MILFPVPFPSPFPCLLLLFYVIIMYKLLTFVCLYTIL